METENKSTYSQANQDTLIFACSGGADVGHLSDAAARQMMKDGNGKMFCLAGIGAKVEGILKTTEDAENILVIDGCSVDCAKKTMELAGFQNFKQFQVTALGYEKGKTTVDGASIRKVADYGKQLI
ncbi:putative zinc-binding protein [bacterium]